MTANMKAVFRPTGSARAGGQGTLIVRFHRPYTAGGRVHLVVDAYPSSDTSQRSTFRRWAHTRERYTGAVRVNHLHIPAEFSGECFFVARLFRQQDNTNPIEGYEATTARIALSSGNGRGGVGGGASTGGGAGASSRATTSLVANVPARLNNLYELLERRRSGPAATADEVFQHVTTGLGANLRQLINDHYRPWPHEIGEDGQPLRALYDWQKWLIQYVTGIYYARNGFVHRSMTSGFGYPAGVQCDTMTDTAAWARGVPYYGPGSGSPGHPFNTLGAARQERGLSGQYNSNHAIYRQANSPRRDHLPHCDWDPVVADASETSPSRLTTELRTRYNDILRSLRPGSILFYRGHIHTVFRVIQAPHHPVRFQLFDTGATTSAASPSPTIYTVLGSRWGGAMKEEPWRTNIPSFPKQGHRMYPRGHVFVPSRPRTWDQLPKVMFQVPNGATSHALSSPDLPLVRLGIKRFDTAEPVFLSSVFELTVPFSQLMFSVSALPNDTPFQVCWMVYGGIWAVGQTERNPIFLTFYNARSTQQGAQHCKLIHSRPDPDGSHTPDLWNTFLRTAAERDARHHWTAISAAPSGTDANAQRNRTLFEFFRRHRPSRPATST